MIDINDVRIDPEFEACCPPLSAEEREQLLANVIREGFREPLIVWLGHSLLIDGHNRFDIWRTAFGSNPDHAPEIVERHFRDRDDVLTWIVRNQLGRRNLTTAARVQLALRLEPALQAEAKARQQAGVKADPRQKSDGGSQPARVDDQVAALAKTSRDTVRKTKAVLASGDDRLAGDMLAGKVSPNAAVQQLKPAPTEPKKWDVLDDISRLNDTVRKLEGNWGLEADRLIIAHWCRQTALELGGKESSGPAELVAQFASLTKKQQREFIGMAVQRIAAPRRIPAIEANVLNSRIKELEGFAAGAGGSVDPKQLKPYIAAIRSSVRDFLAKEVSVPPSLAGGAE